MANLQKLARHLTVGSEWWRLVPSPPRWGCVGIFPVNFVNCFLKFIVFYFQVFILLFVPAFAHAYAVGLACAPVAVCVFRSCPMGAVVAVPQVPCLVWLYGLPATFADGACTLCYEVSPPCSLRLVRLPISSTGSTATLALMSGRMLLAVSCANLDELRTVGPRAPTHRHGVSPRYGVLFRYAPG